MNIGRFEKLRRLVNRNVRNFKIVASIGRNRDPLTAPQEVMVDFCNLCNLHCLICFNYSPLGPCPFTPDQRRSHFPGELFKELIEDCAELGGTRINLAGGGEPLTHPESGELIEEIRKHGLEAAITTNGTLLYRYPALADILTSAVVSVHAGSEEAYRRMHPADSPKQYQRMLEGLELLQSGSVPTIIDYILTTENYMDLESAINLAGKYGAAVAFQPLKPFIRKEEGSLELDPQKKNVLQLTRRHIEELIERKPDLDRLAAERGVSVHGLDDFLSLESGKAAGESDDYIDNPVEDFYESSPCYAGWYFSRILIDGSVTPCCQCKDKITMGNINEKRFIEIWRSPQYRWFREKAFTVPLKSTEIWDHCQCGFCDMVTRNRKFDRIIRGGGIAGAVVRLAGAALRRKNDGKLKKPLLTRKSGANPDK